MELPTVYNLEKTKDKNYRLRDRSGFFNLDFLKKIPIEAYVLIAVPLLSSLWMIIFHPEALSFKTLSFYLFFGDPEISAILNILFLYLIIKITLPVVFPVAKLLIFKEKSKIKELFWETREVLKNCTYFFLLILASGFFLDLSLDNLSFKASHQKIIWISNLLTNWDHFLFGSDLLFWLNNFVNKTSAAVLSNILVKSYDSLSMVVGIFLLILFLKDKTLLKKFIVFFFLITYISMPIWYSAPVLAPIHIYLHDILKTQAPERIALQMKDYQPASVLNSFQADVLDAYKKTGDFLPVTAFPSMHAGWGFGIILYGFIFYWPSIFILLPWFILQMIGAVYTGEHYAIDLFLGMLMAVIAYYLVELLFVLEKKYYKGKGSLFIIDEIQKDFKNFFTFFKNTYKLWQK